MRRIKDGFVDKLEAVVPLQGKRLLEIGCGDGRVAAQLTERGATVLGVDTNEAKLIEARARSLPAAAFARRSATNLQLAAGRYSSTIYSLVLHHILFPPMMYRAIDEGVRVTRGDGHVVFLEPGTTGSFFDAEIRFNAMDGDERRAKASAYQVMKNHPRLQLVEELEDEAVFEFDSKQDFLASMASTTGEDFKNLHELDGFLLRHDYQLNALRRINIYRLRTR